MNAPANKQAIVEEVFALYQKHGADDYIGEPVSQLEHMTQSARLAARQGFDEEVILAAFFHDIGHFLHSAHTGNMDGYGVMRHEKVGADYLRSKGFPEKIARLVESHVQAKRYLTFKNPGYYQQLSEASKRTLEFQGGRMTAAEALAFEQDDLFDLSIKMRQWDEQAKEENIPLPDLAQYKEMALNCLNKT
jgi:phosphonate degradation associated HDIG domain protein